MAASSSIVDNWELVTTEVAKVADPGELDKGDGKGTKGEGTKGEGDFYPGGEAAKVADTGDMVKGDGKGPNLGYEKRSEKFYKIPVPGHQRHDLQGEGTKGEGDFYLGGEADTGELVTTEAAKVADTGELDKGDGKGTKGEGDFYPGGEAAKVADTGDMVKGDGKGPNLGYEKRSEKFYKIPVPGHQRHDLQGEGTKGEGDFYLGGEADTGELVTTEAAKVADTGELELNMMNSDGSWPTFTLWTHFPKNGGPSYITTEAAKGDGKGTKGEGSDSSSVSLADEKEMEVAWRWIDYKLKLVPDSGKGKNIKNMTREELEARVQNHRDVAGVYKWVIQEMKDAHRVIRADNPVLDDWAVWAGWAEKLAMARDMANEGAAKLGTADFKKDRRVEARFHPASEKSWEDIVAEGGTVDLDTYGETEPMIVHIDETSSRERAESQRELNRSLKAVESFIANTQPFKRKDSAPHARSLQAVSTGKGLGSKPC